MRIFLDVLKTVVALAGVLVVAGCAQGYEEPAVEIAVDEPVVTVPTTRTMTIRAGRPGAEGDTRTALDPENNLKVNWQATDKLGVSATVRDSGYSYFTINSPFSIPDGGLNTTTDIATFKGELENDFSGDIPTSVEYYVYYPYAQAAYEGNEYDPSTAVLTLPATQTPTATSFDPAADFLFGSARTTGTAIGKAQGGESDILFEFARPFAIGKLDFSGETTVGSAGDLSNAIVRTVKLTFTNEADAKFDVAGAFTANLSAQTATFDSSTEENVITLDYVGKNIALGNLTAYWIMKSATVDKIELEIIAGDYLISKTITPDNALDFEANHLNRATVNLSGATVTEIDLLDASGAYIPDAQFRVALKGLFGGLDGTNPLSPSQAAAVTGTLDVSNRSPKIADLTGIEYFTGITTLSCYTNNLTALNVSANTALTSLNCADNNLTSLDVSANTALISLWCGTNSLTSLDVSANTALTTLSVQNNSGLTSLTLPGVHSSGNYELRSLSCDRCNFTSLDVSNYTALQTLQCYENNLTSLNLSANTALQNLFCNDNNLNTLNLSANTVLAGLQCNNNSLTSLDISNNRSLTSLQCYGNPGDEDDTFPISAWFSSYATAPTTNFPNPATNNSGYWSYTPSGGSAVTITVAYTNVVLK